MSTFSVGIFSLGGEFVAKYKVKKMCIHKIPDEGIGMDVPRWQRHTLQEAAAYEGALHLWSPLLVRFA